MGRTPCTKEPYGCGVPLTGIAGSVRTGLAMTKRAANTHLFDPCEAHHSPSLLVLSP